MGISVAGIGSSLDVNSIVSQLMAIETQPKTALQTKQSAYNSQISAYSQLKSSLSSLQTSAEALRDKSSFNVYKTTVLNNSSSVADASVIVAADSSAAKGSYKIDVTQLAQNQKLLSGTGAANKNTTTFGDAGSVITVKSGLFTSGQLDVTLGGAVTLEGLRDAINNASGNAGKVTASILDTGVSGDANRYRLTLTSNTTGASNGITGLYLNSGSDNNGSNSSLTSIIDTSSSVTIDNVASSNSSTSNQTNGSKFYVTQKAQDASITIDNTVQVSSTSNTFTNTIQGLTLTATKVTTSGTPAGGTGVNVNVERDLDAVKTKINTFVSSYNSVRSTINSLKSGALYNDLTSLGTIERRLSNALSLTVDTSATGGTMKYLAQVGITQQKDGTLSTAATQGITTGSFDTNMNSNIDEVIKFFAGTDGFATKVATEFKSLAGYDGFVEKRTSTLKSQVKDTQSQIDAMTLRLTAKEKSLRAQFTALDTAMGKMQQTMSYVTSQLG